MGKTLGSFFGSFKLENVANLFLHVDTPNSPYCNNYYRFTDRDALKSIILRWIKGDVVSKCYDPKETRDTNYGALYSIGRKKSPFLCSVRDIIWKFSNVLNPKLKKWAKSFNPDFVFFAPGESVFSYRIACKLASFLKKPLVICCVDDYYIQTENQGQLFAKHYHKKLLKYAKKTIKQSIVSFAFNEEMANAYKELFNRDFPVLYKAAREINNLPYKEKQGFSYLGGLGLRRGEQLVSIGNALQKSNVSSLEKRIDVYSDNLPAETKDSFNNNGGVMFRGQVSSSEVENVIAHSKAVFHVESFDKNLYERLRYSLSTKIPESLGSHTLLVAYGPKGLASIEYLKKHEAAIVSDNIEELVSRLLTVVADEEEYNRIVGNAYRLYLLNHAPESVANQFVGQIEKAIDLKSRGLS